MKNSSSGGPKYDSNSLSSKLSGKTSRFPSASPSFPSSMLLTSVALNILSINVFDHSLDDALFLVSFVDGDVTDDVGAEDDEEVGGGGGASGERINVGGP